MDNLRGFGLYVVIGVGAVLLLTLFASVAGIGTSQSTIWQAPEATGSTRNADLSGVAWRPGTTVGAGRSDRSAIYERQIERLRQQLDRRDEDFRALKTRFDALADSRNQTGSADTANGRTDGIPDNELPAEPEEPDGEEPPTVQAAVDSEDGKLRESLRLLQGQLTTADSLIELQIEELERLENLVARLRSERASTGDLQSEFDRQTAELMQQQRDIEQQASAILRRLGPDATELLEPLLDDRRTHIRLWSADLLSRIRNSEGDVFDRAESFEGGGERDESRN